MTQRGVIKLELEKNEHKYSFEMPIGSPYGEAYDALFEMLQKVVEMSKEAADRIKREEKEEVKQGD